MEKNHRKIHGKLQDKHQSTNGLNNRGHDNIGQVAEGGMMEN